MDVHNQKEADDGNNMDERRSTDNNDNENCEFDCIWKSTDGGGWRGGEVVDYTKVKDKKVANYNNESKVMFFRQQGFGFVSSF